MTESSPAEQVSYAIEFLTAYLAAPATEQAHQQVGEYVQARLTGPDAVNRDGLIVGQILLAAAILLIEAANAGVAPEDSQAWAQQWLAHYGPAIRAVQGT